MRFRRFTAGRWQVTCEGQYGETLSVEVFALDRRDALEQCVQWGYVPVPRSAHLVRKLSPLQRRFLKRSRASKPRGSQPKEVACE